MKTKNDYFARMNQPLSCSTMPAKISIEKKLNYLTEWMVMFINEWPNRPYAGCFSHYVIISEAQQFTHLSRKQRKHAKKQCFYCERPFDSFVMRTLDHVIPLSAGGLNVIANKVWACYDCNQWKLSEPLPTWLKKVSLFINLKKSYGNLSVSDLRKMRGNIQRLIDFVQQHHVFLCLGPIEWVKNKNPL